MTWRKVEWVKHVKLMFVQTVSRGLVSLVWTLCANMLHDLWALTASLDGERMWWLYHPGQADLCGKSLKAPTESVEQIKSPPPADPSRPIMNSEPPYWHMSGPIRRLCSYWSSLPHALLVWLGSSLIILNYESLKGGTDLSLKWERGSKWQNVKSQLDGVTHCIWEIKEKGCF